MNKSTEFDALELTGDYVKDFFAIAKDVNAAASELHWMAQAASIVGNSQLSERLFSLGDRLFRNENLMRKVCSDNVDAGLKQAQQGTANILRALAGGIRMGKTLEETEAGVDAQIACAGSDGAAAALEELARLEEPRG